MFFGSSVVVYFSLFLFAVFIQLFIAVLNFVASAPWHRDTETERSKNEAEETKSITMTS